MYGFTVHVKVRVEENPVTTPLSLSPVVGRMQRIWFSTG
jgi:hypothetical protein